MGLSMLIHDAAYRPIGLPALFLSFSTGDEPTPSLAEFGAGRDELGRPLNGATLR